MTIDDRTLEIADVHCTEQDLVVSLKDGRKIVTVAVVVSSAVSSHAGAAPSMGARRGSAAASTGQTSTRT
jgi:hypothetical protein